jgi:hypothetical protein
MTWQELPPPYFDGDDIDAPAEWRDLLTVLSACESYVRQCAREGDVRAAALLDQLDAEVNTKRAQRKEHHGDRWGD